MKNQAILDARAMVSGVDNPETMRQNAMDAQTPIENQDWVPPVTLSTPQPPSGWKYSWVRTAFRKDGSHPDGDNIRKMLSQGWRPVLAAELSEGSFASTISDARFNNGQATVGVGDMVLMKMPSKMKAQRDAYYAKIAKNQVQGIDEVLHAEARRPGDKFFSDRQTRTELSSAPLNDTDD